MRAGLEGVGRESDEKQKDQGDHPTAVAGRSEDKFGVPETMKNAYQKYKQTSIQSASREKLLLMMYEGAIKFVKLSIQAIEQKRIADKGINIGRAYDIILELNNTLDHKVGGEISKNLEQLYMYITDQLTQANIKNDVQNLKNALQVLETLYDGWQKAIEQLKAKEEKGA